MKPVPTLPRFRRRFGPSVALLVAVAMIAACDGFGSRAPVITNPPRPEATQPPPTPTTHLEPIIAFVKLATSGTFSYRVAFDGHVGLSASRGLLTGRMDVSGSDFATTMTYDYRKDFRDIGKIRALVRGVKDKSWQNVDDAGWKAISGYKAADSNAPFVSVESSADIKFLGAEKYDGKDVYRISIAKAVLIHPRAHPGLVKNEKVRYTTLEILIDANGRPVRGKWMLEGQARIGDSGQLQEITYDLTLAFSKVGAKLTIKKP